MSNSPVASTHVPEPNSLLRREINHDKPIDTHLLAILQHALLAVPHHGIEVSHEKNRRLQTLASRRANNIQDGGDSNTVGQGFGVGSLNSRAIGDGVREGNSQFDNIWLKLDTALAN